MSCSRILYHFTGQPSFKSVGSLLSRCQGNFCLRKRMAYFHRLCCRHKWYFRDNRFGVPFSFWLTCQTLQMLQGTIAIFYRIHYVIFKMITKCPQRKYSDLGNLCNNDMLMVLITTYHKLFSFSPTPIWSIFQVYILLCKGLT